MQEGKETPMPDPKPEVTLSTAQTIAEVIEAVARYQWWEAHKEECPTSEIPTEDILAQWYPHYTKPVFDETETRLTQLFGHDTQWVCFYEENTLSALMSREGSGEPHASPSFESFFTVHDVCRAWNAFQGESRPEHPLGPLVAAWQGRPKPVEPDRRTNAIMPAPFAIVRNVRSEHGQLIGGLLGGNFASSLEQDAQSDMFSNLPGFEPHATNVVPSLPLVLFDASGGVSTARGRGAPLALRLWIECILSVPREARSPHAPARLAVRLDDLISALWPNGWTGPGRDGPKLMEALHRVDSACIRWPGGAWRAVSVTNRPDMSDRGAPVVFDVSLPPGSEAGPMVHRPTLRKYGVRSAPAYRVSLGLAYLWNERLTYRSRRLPPRIPVVRRNDAGYVVDAKREVLYKDGRPVTHWNHPRAVRTGEEVRNPEYQRLPWLEPQDLIALGAAEADARTKQARYAALKQVRKAIRDMADVGDIVLVEDGERMRIEPPDNWGIPIEHTDVPATTLPRSQKNA